MESLRLEKTLKITIYNLLMPIFISLPKISILEGAHISYAEILFEHRHSFSTVNVYMTRVNTEVGLTPYLKAKLSPPFFYSLYQTRSRMPLVLFRCTSLYILIHISVVLIMMRHFILEHIQTILYTIIRCSRKDSILFHLVTFLIHT